MVKDYRDLYKTSGFGCEESRINRALRSQRLDKVRHEKRNLRFSIHRNIEDEEEKECQTERINVKKLESIVEEKPKKTTTDYEVKAQQLWLDLQKWKEEKNQQKIQEKKQAKPVFKVGVVHQSYSNVSKERVRRICTKNHEKMNSPPKRVTRATEKRLAMKACTQQQKQESRKGQKKTTNQPNIKNKQQKISLIPKDYKFRAPSGVKAIPMFGRKATDN